ncbi:MAG: type II secretion system F family protein [Pseudomonadota bacterium]
MTDPATLNGFVDSPLFPVAVFLLVLIAMVGLFSVLFHRHLSGRAAAQRRLEIAIGLEIATAVAGVNSSEQRRKQSIEKALSEMAQRERAKQKAKLTLKMRMNQADLNWSLLAFYIRAILLGSCIGGAWTLALATSVVFTMPVGLLVGLIALNFYVKVQFNKRMKAFIEEFPNAIDVVTRGVKTGLPLGDCFKAIASEGQEPVRSEFRQIVDDVSVGLPLAQALTRFTQRVPVMEANFFAVVVAIQGQLGGNLSEALGNLSRVLRERKMMKEKIKAFSSEATASGGIIASMPVVVASILFLTSPDYIGLLFSEPMGNVVLAGCAVWMTTGVIVMRNMIRFDF